MYVFVTCHFFIITGPLDYWSPHGLMDQMTKKLCLTSNRTTTISRPSPTTGEDETTTLRGPGELQA